jgi:hypothetical protein
MTAYCPTHVTKKFMPNINRFQHHICLLRQSNCVIDRKSLRDQAMPTVRIASSSISSILDTTGTEAGEQGRRIRTGPPGKINNLCLSFRKYPLVLHFLRDEYVRKYFSVIRKDKQILFNEGLNPINLV